MLIQPDDAADQADRQQIAPDHLQQLGIDKGAEQPQAVGPSFCGQHQGQAPLLERQAEAVFAHSLRRHRQATDADVDLIIAGGLQQAAGIGIAAHQVGQTLTPGNQLPQFHRPTLPLAPVFLQRTGR